MDSNSLPIDVTNMNNVLKSEVQINGLNRQKRSPKKRAQLESRSRHLSVTTIVGCAGIKNKVWLVEMFMMRALDNFHSAQL